MPVLYEPDAPEDSFEVTPDCNQLLHVMHMTATVEEQPGMLGKVLAILPKGMACAGQPFKINLQLETRHGQKLILAPVELGAEGIGPGLLRRHSVARYQ